MQICLFDREGFLDWMNGKPSPKPTKLTAAKMRQPLGDGIALIYADPKPTGQSQPVIAVPQDRIANFYAFVGTYLTNYRPFSAFYKVVPFEILSELANASLPNGHMSLPIQRLVGVAIAEVYTQSRAPSKAFDKISVSAVQATLSASLSEAVWQGYGHDRIEDISRRWQTVRGLEHSDKLFLKAEKIAEVWSIVSDVLTGKVSPRTRGSQRKITQALIQITSANHSSHEWLSPFMRDFPGIARNASGLDRSREERVRIVRKILPELLESSSDALSREFLAGAIISMIGNGAFAQISLLDEVLPKLPSAALWFGVLSSFQNGSDALTIGNCLGRRVVRDMCSSSDLFTPIKADIAFEELAMFRNEVKSAPPFRTAHASSMTVNLFANVSGRFKVDSSTDVEALQRKQDVRNRESQKQSEELMYLLDRARHMVGKLASLKQRDLFD
ncbi:hypothetical protein [Neptunicoccus cionae]|uniref:hypothetical protein n=1 Tax=Neptunicoccus cionae TaxID=2035344 RepID=UPI000C778D76|nr:hypothetical protein [Amylibacter cionae]PLS19801.1 hypothetical protein C0U40_19960 [Amylibacter cionae]